ncbi:MAG: transcriptional regulator [Planctomycetota bacterium]
MNSDRHQDILKRIRQCGVIRPKDLPDVTPYQLAKLCQLGLIQRIGRGLYQIANAGVSENHDLAVVGRQTPDSTICLLTALSFHGLTTQMPRATWIAIANKARPPVIEYPSIEIVRMTGKSLSMGIAQHKIDGVKVRVFNPAKTVADCFKFRSRVGLDVAIEALRDYRQLRHGRIDSLWKYAKICRVQSIIRPYLEAIG